MYETVLEWFKEKDITVRDMAEILKDIQKQYIPDLTLEVCEENIRRVLTKREVQHAILTGMEIDRLVEAGLFREPIQSIIARDASLYGIDEILALAIVNVYGTIGFTNYGYLDKVKPGIIAKLDGKTPGVVNTFIDDIVGAVVAAAASRLAHSQESN